MGDTMAHKRYGFMREVRRKRYRYAVVREPIRVEVFEQKAERERRFTNKEGK